MLPTENIGKTTQSWVERGNLSARGVRKVCLLKREEEFIVL
jgi:hypothetical protein